MSKEIIKIGICIPTREQWRSDFGQCLTMMVADFVSHDYENFELGIKLCNAKGSILPQQRADMVEECLSSDCTHILFLDDDMAFPMNTLYTLLGHNKDIIGANAVTKALPPRPTAKNFDNQPIYTTKSSTGVVEVESVGTGVLLIKVEVFKKIPQPWFDFVYRPQGYVGEDVFFCRKAREHGYKVYIDHDISKEVLHIGDFYYNHQMTKEYKNGLFIPEQNTAT